MLDFVPYTDILTFMHGKMVNGGKNTQNFFKVTCRISEGCPFIKL